jgi:hypothetical protein
VSIKTGLRSQSYNGIALACLPCPARCTATKFRCSLFPEVICVNLQKSLDVLSSVAGQRNAANLVVTIYSPDRNFLVTFAVQCDAMDIDALHSTLLSISIVSEKLKAGREMIDQVETVAPGFGDLLEEAEKDLRMAQATLAGELGFNMCPNCWPPELLATDRKGQGTCPNCGEVSLERAA